MELNAAALKSYEHERKDNVIKDNAIKTPVV